MTWWRERRGVGGVQAEAFAWARVAKARRIVQGGFDETQIDSKYEREFSFCRAIASRFAPCSPAFLAEQSRLNFWLRVEEEGELPPTHTFRAAPRFS